MKMKRFFFMAALMCIVGLSYSCDKDTTDDSDDLYSIEKKDIKDEDT